MTSGATWYESLPTPVALPQTCTVQELKRMMDDPALKAGVDYIVVDNRRADMDEAPGDAVIPCAINLPAQSFYQTLPTTYTLLSRIPKVIFHCSSSQGRGPRCAGWYQDLLNSKGKASSESFVLQGGIKAWVKEYPTDIVAF